MVSAFAAQVRTTEVKCADGTLVTAHELVAEAHAGWDADGATYVLSGRPYREVAVTTCPDGMSLRSSDWITGLSPQGRLAAAAAVSEIRPEINGRNPLELPPWERHAHAARLYEALGRHDAASELWLSAAWLVRDQAVFGQYEVAGPALAALVLRHAGGDVLAQTDPEIQKNAMFNLAILAHRGGHYAERDGWLAKLSAFKLDSVQAARVERLRWVAATEPGYLKRAAAALELRRASLTGAGRATMLVQLAEVVRRLGDLERSRTLLDEALAIPTIPTDVAQLARYLLEEQAGGQPWLNPAYRGMTLPQF